MEWNDDLEDQNSAAFKEFSRVFEEEVKGPYIPEMYITKFEGKRSRKQSSRFLHRI